MIIIIHYIIGKGGTGKSHKIIHMINTLIDKNIKEGNPELNKSIYVLVPEQFSFEFDKKLYETVGMFENFNNKYSFSQSLYESIGAYKYNIINVNKFSKLAEDIITKHGKIAKDYINELSRVIAMYQAISRLKSKKSLNVFEKQANNIDFVQLALNEVVDLKKSNISPEDLLQKSIDFPKQVMEKTRDMALIYAEYNKILLEKNLQDATSDILECSVLADKYHYFDDATIFIDEFDAFSLDELKLLEVMISQCKDLYITLRTDNPFNKGVSYFEPVNNTYFDIERIANKHQVTTEINQCDISHRYVSSDLKNISECIFTHNKKYNFKLHGDVSITECESYYQECDYVCSQIRKLILDGYSYKDIFVTARRVDDYLGIIERAFDKYDIPYFLSTNRSSIYTPIMVYFINLLEIISSNTFDTDAILRYVKNPITNVSFENIADLENYCYKWNVKKSMWEEPFQKDDTTTAELTRLNIINPLKELKEKVKNKPCIEVCRCIYSFMEEQSIIKNVQDIIDRNRKENQDVIASDMARLWDMLMTILDTLCIFMSDDVIPMKHFKEIICAMINQSDYKVAPQKLDAVSFSASDNARYNSPKVLFVLGVNDGTFPSSVNSDGIFTNSDMKCFEKVNLNFFKSIQDKTADEKLIVYKTLSAPAEKMYLSYALKNTMGDKKYPSYVVESVKSLFEDFKINYAKNIPVEDWCSTYKASYDYFVKNFWNNSNDLTTVKSVLSADDGLYSSKIKNLERISKNEDLKIQDKNIALKLFKNKIKIYATKFETFNKCHFQYFCSEGLRIKKPIKYDISKIEIGNIIHHCLEKIISSHTKDELVQLSDMQIKSQINEFAVQYKEENLGGDYGKTERFDANFNRIKNSIYQTIKHIQEEFSQLEFVPTDFELIVDENGDCPPLTIKNDDGMEILLCGKIDRVDILENENGSYIRVVDYKSGTQDFETAKIPYGIDMQMFLYLFAVTGENGKYNKSYPAGVLYLPVSELRVKNNFRDTTNGIKDEVNKHFKMKGVVLNDTSVVQAMEKELNGVYIPFKVTKNGKVSKTVLNNVLNSQQFENIRKHAENLIIHMANCLSNGDISARNLVLFNKNDTPCKYCDYWSICGSYPDRNCDFKQKDEANQLYNDIIGEGDEK